MPTSHILPAYVVEMVGVIRTTSKEVGTSSTPRDGENTSLEFELRPWVVAPEPSKADVEELRRQRVACGWYADRIPIWEQEIRNGTRYIWLIHVRTPTGLTEIAGMISLNLYDPTDPSLANFRAPGSLAGDRAEVSLIFIYPKYRGRGILGAASRRVEQKAAELGVTTATGNTMARSEKLRIYEGMGYQQYKPVEKIYDSQEMSALGFGEEHCYAAFIEKKIYPPRQYRL
ncbi:hypothetical protein FRC01_013858 [Tulasnella sp. 417]|nr:hypothetical protein FRC01_013858 [Tulasnella sp. 417]